jgi:hypothetical protein
VSDTSDVSELSAALSAPFDACLVRWRPGATSGTRALAIPYLDARAVMDRLDAVFGLDCWRDEYEFLPDGSALCRLSIRVGGEWLTKMDVGGQSEQPDEGDRRKSAVSDALKRTAVKFGVGRYLYRLPQQWVDYDPQKKQLKNLPSLPGQQAPAKPAAANGSARPDPVADLKGRVGRLDGWLARMGLAEDGWLAGVIDKRAGGLATLNTDGCQDALKDAHAEARKAVKEYVADRCHELSWMPEKLYETAKTAAGKTLDDLPYDQLEKVLAVLATKEESVPV